MKRILLTSLAAAGLVIILSGFDAEPVTDFWSGPPDEAGWWSQYAKTPTDAMIAYRGYENETIATGFIAVLDCDKVGQLAWITSNGSPGQPVRVFDCLGAGGDPSWWRENKMVGELDYYLAKEHGVLGKGGVAATIDWHRN